MTDDPKLAAALQCIADETARITPASREAMLLVLGDCRKALRRAAKRADVPEGFERVEIAQAKGEIVEFTGRMLCSTSFRIRDGGATIDLEIWQTKAGGYIAATAVDRRASVQWTATVIEPAIDKQAMRVAVMDAFGWSQAARRMVRDLGWSFRRDVD